MTVRVNTAAAVAAATVQDCTVHDHRDLKFFLNSCDHSHSDTTTNGYTHAASSSLRKVALHRYETASRYLGRNMAHKTFGGAPGKRDLKLAVDCLQLVDSRLLKLYESYLAPRL